MPSTYTPLRYPGGKAKLGPFLADLLQRNRLTDGAYAEPYAGGAGAALFLLFRGFASRVHLNDIDPSLTSFWSAVLNHTERFAKLIETVPLTVSEWGHQREIYLKKRRGFDLGFAFFYLNRTNRSGIMNGGIIGGREQRGPWLMDARFNRVDLADRIRAVGRMRRYISVDQSDALDFLDGVEKDFGRKSIVYLDPPYFGKGRELYTNFYTADDHAAIARRVGALKIPWVMTYDDCPEIRKLYARRVVRESTLSYSAREVRRGRELVICGPNVRLPLSKARISRSGAGFELL